MSLDEKRLSPQHDEKVEANVTQSPTGTEIEEPHTEAEERRLVRKLDRRILPTLCIVYLLAYLDRTNLGNARLQGLPEDILGGDPTGVLFDWANSAFFFSYIICQIPLTVTSKLFPPKIWMGCATIGWGICSTLMSTAFNLPGLIVTRVGLGAFEAGFAPTMPLYFAYYYTREEIGLRMSYWFGFAAVAGAFGGLIAFGVQHVQAPVANWRLLFIIEGIPTVLVGLLAMVFLPNRPEETNMLNERERAIAHVRSNRGIKPDVGRVVQKQHIIMAFKDWRVYAAGVIYLGANCALSSLSAFLPTIIKTLGFTNALAQLLTVPPYAVAAVSMCIVSYFSDRLQSRGICIAGASSVSAVGYVILLTVPDNRGVRYFATFCITSGTYTCIGLMIAWFAFNLGSETKKATGNPIYMAIGQCGSILGSHLYPATEGPQYIKGFAVTCALQFLAGLAAIVLTVSYRIENRRRDERYGRPIPNAPVDTSVMADKATDFRYVP